MFSIIIPVYNEEAILEENLDKLLKHLQGKDFEIIISNNGSKDRTFEIANKLVGKHNNVKLVSTSRKGPGVAFKNGVKAASGNIIISQDMDLSTDLGFIDQALNLMENHDVVIGSKKTGKQERSFLRTLPSNIFIFLTNVFLGLRYEDYSMASKAYKRDFVMKHLNRLDDGTSYVLELVFFAKKTDKKIADIPVDCFDKRKSKFNILQESLYRFNRLMALFIFRLFNR